MSIDKINDLSLHNSAIAEDLHKAAARVIDSGWYAMGPEVTAFEKAFAAYCGVTDAIGVANGTEAIELALRALDINVGDEVITVANAGFYSSTAIRAIGAVPVYVDIQESNLLMDVACAEKAITPKTKAIIITHLFGQLADMQPLCALAKKHGIALVEDCAQSHGATANGKRAGSFGDIAALVFFRLKISARSAMVAQWRHLMRLWRRVCAVCVNTAGQRNTRWRMAVRATAVWMKCRQRCCQ